MSASSASIAPLCTTCILPSFVSFETLPFASLPVRGSSYAISSSGLTTTILPLLTPVGNCEFLVGSFSSFLSLPFSNGFLASTGSLVGTVFLDLTFVSLSLSFLSSTLPGLVK